MVVVVVVHNLSLDSVVKGPDGGSKAVAPDVAKFALFFFWFKTILNPETNQKNKTEMVRHLVVIA